MDAGPLDEESCCCLIDRDGLRAFYAVHNPEKLDNIDAFLDEAGPGNEEALLNTVLRKYEEILDAEEKGQNHSGSRQTRLWAQRRAPDFEADELPYRP